MDFWPRLSKYDGVGICADVLLDEESRKCYIDVDSTVLLAVDALLIKERDDKNAFSLMKINCELKDGKSALPAPKPSLLVVDIRRGGFTRYQTLTGRSFLETVEDHFLREFSGCWTTWNMEGELKLRSQRKKSKESIS